MSNDYGKLFSRTWWINVYPDGQITGALCRTREDALNHCTYTGESPDAAQVEVRLIPDDPAWIEQIERLSAKRNP